jgi:hypothetical protein
MNPGGADSGIAAAQRDSFRVEDPEERRRSLLATSRGTVDAPPPFSQATRIKSKASQASFLRERLVADKDVFDNDVLFLCRKYHSLHRRLHGQLKMEHQQQVEAQVIQQPVRDVVFTIFENPQSCFAGRIVGVVDLVLVLITLLQFMLETIPRLDPEFNSDYDNVWFSIELIVTLFFTIETFLRFVLSRDKLGFFTNVLNLLDIIAVAPFYLLLLFSASGFGVVKMLRMCRFVKLFRRFRHIDALIVTMTNIGASLVAPMLFLFVSVLLIASFLYFVEGGHFIPAPAEFVSDLAITYANATTWAGRTGHDAVLDALAASKYNKFYVQDCYCSSTPAYVLGNRTCPDVPTRFHSALQAMWFAIVTITTTGYGDHVPLCAGGKLIASVGLLLSTIFLAMPIAIVGASFTETVAAMHARDDARKKATAGNIAVLRMNAEMALHDGATLTGDEKRTTTTAGEGLAQYLASALRVPRLELNRTDQVFAQEPPSSENEVSRRYRLVHHVNTYTSKLLESWTVAWIVENIHSRLNDGTCRIRSALLHELLRFDVRTCAPAGRLHCSVGGATNMIEDVLFDCAAEASIDAFATDSEFVLDPFGCPRAFNVCVPGGTFPQAIARVVQIRGFLRRRYVLLRHSDLVDITVNSCPVPAAGLELREGDVIQIERRSPTTQNRVECAGDTPIFMFRVARHSTTAAAL